MGMYDDHPKKSDNDALNEILNQLQQLNRKVGLFYWLAIISLVLAIVMWVLENSEMGVI